VCVCGVCLCGVCVWCARARVVSVRACGVCVRACGVYVYVRVVCVCVVCVCVCGVINHKSLYSAQTQHQFTFNNSQFCPLLLLTVY